MALGAACPSIRKNEVAAARRLVAVSAEDEPRNLDLLRVQAWALRDGDEFLERREHVRIIIRTVAGENVVEPVLLKPPELLCLLELRLFVGLLHESEVIRSTLGQQAERARHGEI